MSNVTPRSYQRIRKADLLRLLRLAQADLAALFERKPNTAKLYRGRVIGIALCQGAAEHFVRPGHGVKDFDVWVFFKRNPARPFPYRRRGKLDFGSPRFGRHPGDKGYIGRRVDVIGRDIEIAPRQSAQVAIVAYIARGRTKSASFLRMRPAVMLWPSESLGNVVWDPKRVN